MTSDDRLTELRRGQERVELELRAMHLALNGRLRALELWRARVEGALFTSRLVPLVLAALAVGAAWVAVLR